jgi:hypothetical protein
MTRSLIIGLFASVLMCASARLAAAAAVPDDKEPRRLEVVEGVIKAVDPANSTFIITLISDKKAVQPDEVKLTFDQKTNFWLDGKPSTMEDAMKAGNTAVVTHMSGLALKVQVKSKPV